MSVNIDMLSLSATSPTGKLDVKFTLCPYTQNKSNEC